MTSAKKELSMSWKDLDFEEIWQQHSKVLYLCKHGRSLSYFLTEENYDDESTILKTYFSRAKNSHAVKMF